MKKATILLTLMIGWLSCTGESSSARAAGQVKDHVEIIYFHGKQRCATCMAIEKETKAVVEQQFADDARNGNVVFRTVDISTSEGEKIADGYEVTWSSLFVNKWKNGKESRHNMTEFGFSHARKNPDGFKKGLAERIRQSLK